MTVYRTQLRRFSALAGAALAAWLLAACSTGSQISRVSQMVKPYQIDRVQGNVVTREQAAALRPGMPRNVVREILGTPLLTSVFHADRWDYVFSFNRQGAPLQSRQVTLFFKGDVLERLEADDLPSESEFVATLKSGAMTGKLPALEASPEALQKFTPKDPQQQPVPALQQAPGLSAASNSAYPPLEASGNAPLK